MSLRRLIAETVRVLRSSSLIWLLYFAYLLVFECWLLLTTVPGILAMRPLRFAGETFLFALGYLLLVLVERSACVQFLGTRLAPRDYLRGLIPAAASRFGAMWLLLLIAIGCSLPLGILYLVLSSSFPGLLGAFTVDTSVLPLVVTTAIALWLAPIAFVGAPTQIAAAIDRCGPVVAAKVGAFVARRRFVHLCLVLLPSALYYLALMVFSLPGDAVTIGLPHWLTAPPYLVLRVVSVLVGLPTTLATTLVYLDATRPIGSSGAPPPWLSGRPNAWLSPFRRRRQMESNLDMNAVERLRVKLGEYETEYLLGIWNAPGHEEWTPEALEAIRAILEGRLGKVPPAVPLRSDTGRTHPDSYHDADRVLTLSTRLSAFAKVFLFAAIGLTLLIAARYAWPMAGTAQSFSAEPVGLTAFFKLGIDLLYIVGYFFLISLVSEAVLLVKDLHDEIHDLRVRMTAAEEPAVAAKGSPTNR